MTRKLRRPSLPLFVLALVAALAAAKVAAAQADQPAGGAPDSAAMEAMMKAMSPGEHHKLLEHLVGDWTFSNTMWMDPSTPPETSGGTMHGEWILGGRYVQTVWKGEFMGQPFEGRGIDGYDNLAGQYVSSWIDNAGTGVLMNTGTAGADGKTLAYTGDMIDPMTRQKIGTKSVVTFLDADTFKTEMWTVDASGKSFKTMEITGKRKK